MLTLIAVSAYESAELGVVPHYFVHVVRLFRRL